MKEKLSQIELLLLDVDGVLTDGTITYADSGEQVKSFHSSDGLGLRMLMDAGIGAGIITGRSSKALEHRCKNLGITLLFQGIRDKADALEQICADTGIKKERIAYMGDDLIDLPVMKKVGLSICVADGSQDVKDHADMVTDAPGGKGAVREVCEAVLKSKGLWQTILDRFLA